MKKTISYLYVILGAACWGFIGLFNRMLGEAGVSGTACSSATSSALCC